MYCGKRNVARSFHSVLSNYTEIVAMASFATLFTVLVLFSFHRHVKNQGIYAKIIIR